MTIGLIAIVIILVIVIAPIVLFIKVKCKNSNKVNCKVEQTKNLEFASISELPSSTLTSRYHLCDSIANSPQQNIKSILKNPKRREIEESCV